METLACQNCGTTFQRHRKSGKPQMHCSDDCRRAWARKGSNQRRRDQFPTTCRECGGPVIQPERGRPRQFCGIKCKQRFNNRRGNRSRVPVSPQAERPCRHCGKPFVGRVDRRFCYECSSPSGNWKRLQSGTRDRMVGRVVVCDNCGSEFVAKHPKARWCSQLCSGRHHKRVASRRRQPVASTPYADRDIFERDGWVCHICKLLIDETVPRSSMDGATIDHVIPIARGGADAPDNVAAAHNRCNREKWMNLL